MSEWWLISLLFSIAFLGSLVLVYPLRAQKTLSVFLFFVVFLIVALGYALWGGFPAWQDYTHQQAVQVAAKEMLKTVKSPEELIEKLKAILNNSPKSAKGWYLLGRLYTNQNETSKAVEAFAKAHELQPNNEQYSINYAHSLWSKNYQKFNSKIVALLEQLLQSNPNQPDALAMMAMNAYLKMDSDTAISYWQRLLKILPPASEEAKAIRKAIAQSSSEIQVN